MKVCASISLVIAMIFAGWYFFLHDDCKAEFDVDVRNIGTVETFHTGVEWDDFAFSWGSTGPDGSKGASLFRRLTIPTEALFYWDFGGAPFAAHIRIPFLEEELRSDPNLTLLFEFEPNTGRARAVWTIKPYSGDTEIAPWAPDTPIADTGVRQRNQR
jgi:hypothetical protein